MWLFKVAYTQDGVYQIALNFGDCLITLNYLYSGRLSMKFSDWAGKTVKGPKDVHLEKLALPAIWQSPFLRWIRCHLEENAQWTLDFVSALEAYVSSQTGICGFDRYHSFQERPRLIFDFRGLRACNPHKYKGQISTSSIHTPLADKWIRIQCKRHLNNMSVFVINGNSTLPTIGYLHQ